MSKRCCLVIDGVVVNESLSVPDGVMLMFAAYYVLNIVYPEELAATLEFIQRSVHFMSLDCTYEYMCVYICVVYMYFLYIYSSILYFLYPTLRPRIICKSKFLR